jgi:hypothetical protein
MIITKEVKQFLNKNNSQLINWLKNEQIFTVEDSSHCKMKKKSNILLIFENWLLIFVA